MVQIERVAGLTPNQRCQAAALAMWRWRAPVLAFEPDEEWGIQASALESLFQLAAASPGEESNHAYRQAAAELCQAPLFASEADPNTVQLVQLETMANLLTFGELLDEPDSDKAERVVESSSGLATCLDALVEGSFCSHPEEEAHRQYLASLAGDTRSQGYFTSRNLVVESTCHNALPALASSARLLDSSTGRELLTLCEDFGDELVTTLRWLRTTGH
ncbi:hypothetical protein ACFCYB_23610 [Streptomyces sp. NPDC056309]|uniref:hypothetical protein n=1 Tax=unclassified Streptomyces TaxID=2593676 RepID=UPI0035D83DA2